MTTLNMMVEALIQQASGQHPAMASAALDGQVLGLGTQHDQVIHTDPAHIDRTVVNQLIDSALGGLAGTDMHENAFAQPQRQASFILKLIPLVLHWIKQQGGLHEALQTLRQQGLQTQVASWVGSGVNDRITPDRLDDVLAQSNIDTLAQQFGIHSSTVATGIAVVLPQVIDILTNSNAIDISRADLSGSNIEDQTTIEINNVLTRLNHL
ncbi:MAG: DUF937 domain-containing protein [Moraxellaceae bacterium]|nr:MAG: DUF937 domain-containing protein [Moraxellaceae bacterium]